MINRSRQKIYELRRQPEQVRLRAALVIVASVGIAITLVSLAALLPLQVYLTRRALKEQPAAQQNVPQVGGVSDKADR